jgi:hypothetical protein
MGSILHSDSWIVAITIPSQETTVGQRLLGVFFMVPRTVASYDNIDCFSSASLRALDPIKMRCYRRALLAIRLREANTRTTQQDVMIFVRECCDDLGVILNDFRFGNNNMKDKNGDDK